MTSLARQLRVLLALALLAGNAQATFHLWQITQAYSNADGTVQYVQLVALAGGQQFLAGHSIASSQGSTTHTFNFTRNLTGDTADAEMGDGYGYGTMGPMSYRSLLIGTQAFANLNVVAPDFIIPDGFLFTTNGRLDWGGGFDVLAYAALPTDGVNAMYRGGMSSINTPQNFSGASGSIAPTAQALNVQGLWWRSPAQSEAGWGVNITHQGDTLFATWFTYDVDGSGMWLVMPNGAKSTTNTWSGSLYRTTGPSFDSSTFDSTKVSPIQVGSATFAFNDSDTGSFAYTVNGVSQTKPIMREAFNPTMPKCTAGGAQAATPNFQDLWWHSPANSEAGWGINITHQGDIIFATWFTYGPDGKGMWIVMAAGMKTAASTYSGKLYRTTGPAFSTVPFDPSKVVATEVGSGTFTFSDASNGTFAYSLNGVTQAKPITREVFTTPTTVCR
jgi:hypothetical protein